MSSRIILGQMLVLAFSVVAAQAQSDDSGLVNRGRIQFGASCSFCHGLEATGGAEGPNLMRSSLVRHDSAGELITQVILNGRPGKGMPAISLNAEQIKGVVAFLHARLAQSDHASPKAPGEDFDLQRLLTGSSDAGKVYFNGAGRCSGCHSPTGDLAHVASKYGPADLQAKFLYPETDEAPPVTITLRSGTRIQGKLVEQDHFYVGIHDQDGWYRSWPLDQVNVAIQDPLAAHVKQLGNYTNADIHNLFAYLETLK